MKKIIVLILIIVSIIACKTNDPTSSSVTTVVPEESKEITVYIKSPAYSYYNIEWESADAFDDRKILIKAKVCYTDAVNISKVEFRASFNTDLTGNEKLLGEGTLSSDTDTETTNGTAECKNYKYYQYEWNKDSGTDSRYLTGMYYIQAKVYDTEANSKGNSDFVVNFNLDKGFETEEYRTVNPTGLRLYKYIPSNMPATASPLVMAIHGCSQNAGSYSTDTGWNQLAEQYKFYVVYADKPGSACYVWYDEQHQKRGFGEIRAMAEMVNRMKTAVNPSGTLKYSIDAAKVFAEGLSAGAGITSSLVAAYPDIFKAMALKEGIPYRAATTLSAANVAMAGLYPDMVDREHTKTDDLTIIDNNFTANPPDSATYMSTVFYALNSAYLWGIYVTNYSNYSSYYCKPLEDNLATNAALTRNALLDPNNTWYKDWDDLCTVYNDTTTKPRVIVFQGSGDQTVYPQNMVEIAEQWAYVHRLSGLVNKKTFSNILWKYYNAYYGALFSNNPALLDDETDIPATGSAFSPLLNNDAPYYMATVCYYTVGEACTKMKHGWRYYRKFFVKEVPYKLPTPSEIEVFTGNGKDDNGTFTDTSDDTDRQYKIVHKTYKNAGGQSVIETYYVAGPAYDPSKPDKLLGDITTDTTNTGSAVTKGMGHAITVNPRGVDTTLTTTKYDANGTVIGSGTITNPQGGKINKNAKDIGLNSTYIIAQFFGIVN